MTERGRERERERDRERKKERETDRKGKDREKERKRKINNIESIYTIYLHRSFKLTKILRKKLINKNNYTHK